MRVIKAGWKQIIYIYIPDAPCMVYVPLFTYIWVIFWANVGKYSSTMEHMGIYLVGG